MALSEDARRKRRNVGNQMVADYTVGTGEVIHYGALVVFDTATKRADKATAATSRKFIGMAEEAATGNTAGTVTVKVSWNYEAELPVVATQITEVSARVGINAFVSDDDTVTTGTNAGTAGVRVRVGEIVEVDTTNSTAWVALRQFSQDDA